MFPHDKLDWTLSRLERHLDASPDDVVARTEYASASLSRAWFHDGGEQWANTALTQARRVLHHDPGNATAMVIAGLSLALMDRLDPAERDVATRLRDAARLVTLTHLAHKHRVANFDAGDAGHAPCSNEA